MGRLGMCWMTAVGLVCFFFFFFFAFLMSSLASLALNVVIVSEVNLGT